MTTLTKAEKHALRESLGQNFSDEGLREKVAFAPDTLEARLKYIQFATEVAKLFQGKKPVDFDGEHWKL